MTPGATTSGSMIFPDGTPRASTAAERKSRRASVAAAAAEKPPKAAAAATTTTARKKQKAVETDGRLKLRVDALGDDDEAKVHLAGGGAEEDRRDARRDQRRRLRAAGHALLGEKDELRVGEAEVTARDDGWRFVFRGAC